MTFAVTVGRLKQGIVVGVVCAAGLLGCEPAQSEPPSDPPPDAAVPAQRTHCSMPVEQTHAPRSIPEVVALLNELPKPVTLPCFLEQLERPLGMQATRSVFSAQPADGERSPRLFLFFEPLIMSIVASGVGSALLEFGEKRSATTSLKGELEFPIYEQLGPEAPFEQVMFDETVTSCSFCHRDEQPDALTTDAQGFVSQALRPRPMDRLGVVGLYAQHAVCDETLEPERCALLEALLAGDAVFEREFPAAQDTFF